MGSQHADWAWGMSCDEHRLEMGSITWWTSRCGNLTCILDNGQLACREPKTRYVRIGGDWNKSSCGQTSGMVTEESEPGPSGMGPKLYSKYWLWAVIFALSACSLGGFAASMLYSGPYALLLAVARQPATCS